MSATARSLFQGVIRSSLVPSLGPAHPFDTVSSVPDSQVFACMRTCPSLGRRRRRASRRRGAAGAGGGVEHVGLRSVRGRDGTRRRVHAWVRGPLSPAAARDGRSLETTGHGLPRRAALAPGRIRPQGSHTVAIARGRCGSGTKPTAITQRGRTRPRAQKGNNLEEPHD